MKHQRFPETMSAWHRRVLSLAWPIILSNLSVPLVGVVDTAVVGRLDNPGYIAAVAVGTIIFSSVFWVFGFLRMGTTGFVSQAFGRNDRDEVSRVFVRALCVALVLGGVLILLQVPIASLAFYLMHASEEVTTSAEVYFSVRIWSAPATFINYCVLGCLFGMQKMRLALLTQLILNGSNILLDVYFVLSLGWDVDGVALASVVSDYIAAGFGLWFVRGLLKPLFTWHAVDTLSSFMYSVLAPAKMKSLFIVNGHLFIRTLFLTSAFFFFTAQGAQLGTVVLAANAILINMLHMLAYGLDGFAHAAEALVGGAYGAKQKNAFQSAVKSSTLWAAVVAVFISGLFAVFGHELITLMSNNIEVLASANQYLPWLIVTPLIAVWSYQLDGIFIGTMHTKDMRNTVGIALVLYVVMVLIAVRYFGNHGLWGSLLLFLFLRGILLALRYPKLLSEIS